MDSLLSSLRCEELYIEELEFYRGDFEDYGDVNNYTEVPEWAWEFTRFYGYFLRARGQTSFYCVSCMYTKPNIDYESVRMYGTVLEFHAAEINFDEFDYCSECGKVCLIGVQDAREDNEEHRVHREFSKYITGITRRGIAEE